MTERPWMSTWLSPLALSNTALAWATIIGGFSTLVLVPGTSGLGLFTWPWLGVVAASQAAFALIIVAVRACVPRLGPVTVLMTLAVSGAVRGAVIAVGAGVVGVSELSVPSILSRSLNSAVISVIGVALIGATLAWRADFRAEYRLLRDRALLLGTAAHDGETIDPSVLDAWTSMKGGLDSTLRQASDSLAAGSSAADMNAAADVIAGAVEQELRPAARAMWQDAIPPERPIRLRALLYDTIARWRLPLLEILGFLAVVVGIGSLVRSGIVAGGAYTVRYLLVTALVLWASTSLAKVLPRFAPLIAIVTLVLLPPLVLLADVEIGDVLLGLPEDPTGQIIVALQTPVTVVLIAMAVGAVRDRQQVLGALQARIDTEVAVFRHQGGRLRQDAQRLSLYVHHSVQSELSALAMQLREAASTGDADTMDDVRHMVLDRIEQLRSIDPYSPPWLREETGRERIFTVVGAWTGILDVSLDIPEASACRPDQWDLAAQVIEEGLANAARHGGASRVAVTGRLAGEDLLLELADDGEGSPSSHGAAPGVGTQWLDRVARGDWNREQTPHGTVLAVRLRKTYARP